MTIFQESTEVYIQPVPSPTSWLRHTAESPSLCWMLRKSTWIKVSVTCCFFLQPVAEVWQADQNMQKNCVCKSSCWILQTIACNCLLKCYVIPCISNKFTSVNARAFITRMLATTKLSFPFSPTSWLNTATEHHLSTSPRIVQFSILSPSTQPQSLRMGDTKGIWDSIVLSNVFGWYRWRSLLVFPRMLVWIVSELVCNRN